jgi:hypothetical protein
MNKASVIVIALIIAGGIAFSLLRDRPESSEQNQTHNQAAMDPIIVSLPGFNFSEQAGRAYLSDESGKTKVAIDISPWTAGTAQPASIRAGTCPSVGAVRYPLNNVVDGKSETLLVPALHFIHGLGDSIIAIGKSAAEPDVIVSCGNLKKALDDAQHIGM